MIKMENGLIWSFALSQTSNNFSNVDLNRDLSFGRKDKSSEVLIYLVSSHSWDTLGLAIWLPLNDMGPTLWMGKYFKILDLEPILKYWAYISF